MRVFNVQDPRRINESVQDQRCTNQFLRFSVYCLVFAVYSSRFGPFTLQVFGFIVEGFGFRVPGLCFTSSPLSVFFITTNEAFLRACTYSEEYQG